NLDPSLGGNAITPTLTELESNTTQPAQMTGLNGYEVDPIFTVGEQINNYAPPGILDGLGAFALDEDTVRVLANHELRSSQGYVYTLANGTELTGARVSYFDISVETRELQGAGLAYDKIINRAGEVVDEASDLEFEGINRLCSAQYIEAHQFGDSRGLEDAMFFTGEETFGGTEFVIDPATNTMYAVPWMGRAAWESVTELDTGTTNKVALLVGDDREAAPLLMYVGEKDNSNPDDFLARNGLKGGKLYVWVPDGDVADTPTFLNEDGEPIDADNAPDPFGFNGTGNSLTGTWVELDYYRPDRAGSAFDIDGDGSIQDELGYDEQGFATQALQDRLFIQANGFQFSRPEDVATNPEDGTEAVLASTGRSGRFPEDSWGTTYTVNTEFDAEGNPLTAQIDILYDGDDSGTGQFANPDEGLRSPDNLEWADNGQIYIQEDRSFGEFGLTSGEEASIWRLDPDSGVITRVAQMDRSAVPKGQTDSDPDDIGDWESSGIIDVSSLFGEDPGKLFIGDVQAHSLRDGVIETEGLVQGGQLFFLEAPQVPAKNQGNSVIFIHPDGASPSHYAAGRFASVGVDGRLNWDNMTNAGVYLGHMDDRIVATSNGGAVAHAYGIKPFLGSYGLDQFGNPYNSLSGRGMTIMEEAIEAGKATAVINSGFIAEPGTGVFLADVDSRRDVTGITAQIVESGVDVIMGGGEIHYLPVGTVGRFGEEGIREDGRNLIEEAEAMGYTVVYTREELESLSPDEDKVLGIFAAEDTYNDAPEGALVEQEFVDENGELILYGQAGNENPPTVAEMLETTLGLDIFSNNENGMFVVLEEEGTDNFGNNNNAAGTIEAVLRADAAIGVAQDYIDNINPNTLLITAADSDGGGLEVDDIFDNPETVGTTRIQPPFETRIPYDGTTGNDTAPFVTGAPDVNGDTFEFGVLWSGNPDVAGSIVSKTYGLNAEKLPATVDNTGIYRLMYETLFDVELAPPTGVPDSITPPPEPTKDTGNVIFIHPDGTSPSHYAAARFASVGADGRLNWDNMTDAGVYLGHMDNRIVSTSNGGAVVHAYGIKPFAGSYGLDEEGNPYTSLSGREGTTIMEEAIAAGKPTAVINSGFIAEPGTGVFLADVESRRDVTGITLEIVESGVDVIMGGGEIHYLPIGTVGRFGEEGIREDGRNLIEEAEAMGYTVIYTREELESLSVDEDKVLGIFAAEDTYNDEPEATLVEEGFVKENGELILYGQSGNENPPTVAEMLEATLELDKFAKAEDGFMVVLEEEGSDNFPNDNNGAGAVEATLRADAAIGVAQDFVNNINPNTLILTAADSDAGGLEVIDVSADSETVGTIGIQSTLASFGPDADGIPVPLDGTTGNDTAPFTTGAPDANGDSFNFGITYASTTDVAGSIVSKAYGLNSDLLTSTVDNTDMYRIMYQTLFGVAPEEVAIETPVEPEPTQVEPIFGSLGEDTIEVTGSNELVFTGAENDLIDAIASGGGNRIYAMDGDDILILGTGDRFSGGAGDDQFFAVSGGNNTITGDAGADQFWIANADIPETANVITDFTTGEDVIGVAGLGISFSDLTFTDSDLGAVIAVNDSELAIFNNINADSLSNEEFFVIV
nr:alkaline phosphatase [Xenococcaceae cyanobacterium MO_188.B19]